MISDQSAKRLHDKATQGHKLSAKEQKLLESWYARQDAIESEMLAHSRNDMNVVLDMQVKTAEAELSTILQRIQKITAENDALRRQNVGLRRELNRRMKAHRK